VRMACQPERAGANRMSRQVRLKYREEWVGDRAAVRCVTRDTILGFGIPTNTLCVRSLDALAAIRQSRRVTGK
jgi:hypothetical protein